MLTEGARLVAKLVAAAGAAEVARRLHVSEAMVRHMATGRKKPGPKLKPRLALLGVPASAWDQEATSPVVTEKVISGPYTRRRLPLPADADPPERPVSAGKLSGVAELRATIQLYDEQIDELQVAKRKAEERGADDALAFFAPPTSAWVQLLRGKADACDKLAKLQGEGEITMAMIVRSKAWRELLGALKPVLEAHPEVATEIADVLEALEGP